MHPDFRSRAVLLQHIRHTRSFYDPRCVDLSRTLDLAFSGIDLRIAPDGAVYCFEVNPCPAYTYYESHTNQPIAARLAEYLSGHDNYYRRVWQL
ncbi:MAG: hypothetical protein EOO78_06335 [Oxalobacteraceae bacterium]|nr:MAG: hypothetical protein EOO78_06335 [Oxalobacteraceae bacterium]